MNIDRMRRRLRDEEEAKLKDRDLRLVCDIEATDKSVPMTWNEFEKALAEHGYDWNHKAYVRCMTPIYSFGFVKPDGSYDTKQSMSVRTMYKFAREHGLLGTNKPMTIRLSVTTRANRVAGHTTPKNPVLTGIKLRNVFKSEPAGQAVRRDSGRRW